MADAPEIIAGPARDWLVANRQGLNGRFRRAQRSFPQLDPQAVLALCRELLPPLAGVGENGSADLLSSAYDLILLHAGRGTLAPGGGSLPGIGVLLRETLPRLRRLLLTRPQSVPPALSNAVENLGARGPEFARALAMMADFLPGADALLDAGAVLAWHLGESRLRTQALEKVRNLPPRVALTALGLADWPEQAAPLVRVGLAADGWCPPRKLLSEQTLAGLAKQPPERLQALLERVSARPAEVPASWALAGRLGNFLGFEGHFEQPPLLLDAGSQGSRHRFWVRSGSASYRLDADVFGWVCIPDLSNAYPVRKGDRKVDKSMVELRLPAGATSFVAFDNALAFTSADSFRVRILTPMRNPL
jgi:hypothetical protein